MGSIALVKNLITKCRVWVTYVLEIYFFSFRDCKVSVALAQSEASLLSLSCPGLLSLDVCVFKTNKQQTKTKVSSHAGLVPIMYLPLIYLSL